MTVEVVDEGLNRWLAEVSKVGSCLPWGLTKHHELWIYQSKGINDHFSFYTLDGVHNYSNSSLVQCLKTLLGVDINPRKPASEARVRVVPPNDHLRARSLFQHVKHLRLEDRIHCFNAHTRPALRHCENIHYMHRVIVDELSKHESHNLHGHACASVLEHLQQRQRGNVGDFSSIRYFSIHAGCAAHAGHPALAEQGAEGVHCSLSFSHGSARIMS
mmetsp:Transcript_18668/g.45793  ORF Transcript_18668/g.45793 Transcript_18668/m.45793 type:complete len:216 (+) Transcript_18668:303-950(+)